nr:dynamin family protein [uncultured Bacteroides sp.]
MKNIADRLDAILQYIAPELKRKGKENALSNVQYSLDLAKKGEVKVLICGEFKRGKSSFINALLGEKVCPVDDDICTSAVSIIKYGPEPKIVRSYGDLSHPVNEEIPFDQISNYSVGTTEDISNTFLLSIELPNEKLKNGLILIDTPGVGGLDPRHVLLTNYFLSQTDITFFMTDINEPLTNTELNFYKNKIYRYSKLSAIIVNKTDMKLQPDVTKVVEDTKIKIANEIGIHKDNIRIISVSSSLKNTYNRCKVEKKLIESNFQSVEKLLEELILNFKKQYFLSIRDFIAKELTSLIEPLSVQLTQIKTPDKAKIEELQQKGLKVNNQLNELNNPSSEFNISLLKQIADIREQVINHLTEQSIIFSNDGLTKLLLNPLAAGVNGHIWVAEQLNLALESLGAEIILKMKNSFTKITTLPILNDNLQVDVKDFSYRVHAEQLQQDTPLHRLAVSAMPGMGVGFAVNTILGFFTGGATWVVQALAISAGVATAIGTSNDALTREHINQIKTMFSPQINVAITQMRTSVETSFTDFSTELRSVLGKRVKEIQVENISLVSALKEQLENAKLCMNKKNELERAIKPLKDQLKMVNILLTDPLHTTSSGTSPKFDSDATQF